MTNISIPLDAKDRKLLAVLDLDARLGTTALGKKIRLSQEGTHYRMQRLEEKGIIRGYSTLLNFAKIGYTGYGVYARFHNVTSEQKKFIIDELKGQDHIYWIAEFGGKYDVAFAIMARNIIEFNELCTDIMSRHSEHLKDTTVAARVELVQFPRKYLLENHNKIFPRFGTAIENIELDDLDREILGILAADARMPALQIAQQIERPVSTVSNRIKALENKGVIQGYSSLIDCSAFRYQGFQLFIQAQNLTKDSKRKLYGYCKENENIIFYIETVGKWNFEIIYEVASQKEFQELLIDIRSRFADIIRDVESIMLFDHNIKYNQFPLGESG